MRKQSCWLIDNLESEVFRWLRSLLARFDNDLLTMSLLKLYHIELSKAGGPLYLVVQRLVHHLQVRENEEKEESVGLVWR